MKTTIPRKFTCQGVTASFSDHPVRQAHLYTYDGIVDTLSGHARRVGLSVHTCRVRLRRVRAEGRDESEIFRPVSKGVAYRGIVDTWAGHARRYGLEPRTVFSRLCRWGRTPDKLPRVFGHDPQYQPELILYDGIRATLCDHARRLGIEAATVYRRIKFLGLGEKVLPLVFRPVRKPVSVTYQGVTDTVSGHCRRLGLDVGRIRQRISAWGLAEATLPKVFAPGRLATCPPKLLAHGGVTDTCSGWARRLGVDVSTVRGRLRKMSVADALGRPLSKRHRHNVRMVTIGGVTRPIAEWARMNGIMLPTVYGRMLKGWPVEEALFTPVGCRRAPTDPAAAVEKLKKHRLAGLNIVI